MNTKKIKDYFNKGVRQIKHRKGFGVHSPFAYSIITDVIEEKTPYYAYSSMQNVYKREAKISFKVACLLLRLVNRFKSRRILEICSDGGYSVLPIMLADSRNEITSVADKVTSESAIKNLKLVEGRMSQLTFIKSLSEISDDYKADMIVVSSLPEGITQDALYEWLLLHIHDSSVVFAKGIQCKQQMEQFWDAVCDNESIEITMDLYDYGLAIRKSNFYKQHYIVAF